jgi:hypothetical protein
MSARAFDMQEVAGAKILDPRVVQGSHGRAVVAIMFSITLADADRQW